MIEGHFEPNGPDSYRKDEVDAFADLVEREMGRVVEENTDLKAAVAEQAAVIAQLRAELGND
ncbi:hypothetical protein [Nocardia brasiliensis]|uniref:hypothetical protein n=1 Tax=Nocardia brasiliensis TaxID=37326 RepID=UPI0024537F63|nr:hypothetical protein [Nocardia brasiliensis]